MRNYQFDDFYKKIINGNQYEIERDVDDILGKTSSVYNFWAPLKKYTGEIIGVIGIQFKTTDLLRLLPPMILGAPYELSYISIYE